MIQSILFDKRYWNYPESLLWLRENDLKPIKPVHETLNFYRFRMYNPNPLKEYYTKEIMKGVKFIIQ